MLFCTIIKSNTSVGSPALSGDGAVGVLQVTVKRQLRVGVQAAPRVSRFLLAPKTFFLRGGRGLPWYISPITNHHQPSNTTINHRTPWPNLDTMVIYHPGREPIKVGTRLEMGSILTVRVVLILNLTWQHLKLSPLDADRHRENSRNEHAHRTH